MSKEVYTGEYDATKLNNGEPDEIMVVVNVDCKKYDAFVCTVTFQTDYLFVDEKFSANNTSDLRVKASGFLNRARIDMSFFFDVPIDTFEVALGSLFDVSDYGNNRKKKIWHFSSLSLATKQKEVEEEQRRNDERENGWVGLSSNNIDMRLPEASITKSQQFQVAKICNSKMITLFEDYDERYGMMYFELQPSTFLESMRFGFKQISGQEDYKTVRNSKECRNRAMRAVLPIVGVLSQYCEAVEEEQLFDLIDGKIERICFHGKEDKETTAFSSSIKDSSFEITRPVQLIIPHNSRACSLKEGKEGGYEGYKAFIECAFDVGNPVKYIYFENSLTEDDTNYFQCPVPKDVKRRAKAGIIEVLKNGGFSADFDVIAKFKDMNNKSLYMKK